MLSPSDLKEIAKAIKADKKKGRFRFFICFAIVFAILLLISFLVRDIPFLRLLFDIYLDVSAG
jgi:Na+/melibiose symporter-like transporter